MIVRCQGAQGEPGWQADIDGQVSECFTYNPDDVMSKIRAMNAVSDFHDEIIAARGAGVPQQLGPAAPPL